MPVLFLSDVEGRWDKLVDFCADNAWVRLEGERLSLSPGATLVFGGDTIDRGPAGRRVLRALVDAADRYPDAVVLLAGNRDINKLRLPRELNGHPRTGAPTGPSADLLRWTLSRTMGAAEAFDHRAIEVEGGEEVVESMLADVAEGGLLLAYLSRARLAFRSAETLFVHGAVLDEGFGVVPGGRVHTDVDAWIAALNEFYADQLAIFAGDPRGTGHAPLVAYQAPVPGTRANPGSVVYGRPVDALGNAVLPSPELCARLRDQGVRRLVVGHTPAGPTPSVVRGAIELVVADSSYARPERGQLVEVEGARTRVRAWAAPGGAPQQVEWTLDLDEPSAIGTRDAEGFLVKGRLADGRWLRFRFLPGFEPDESVG